MTKLEKGMYIRFNKLTNYYENKLMNIYKIKNITEIICSSQECLCIIFEESNEDIIFTKNFLKKYIVNASFNIIDLIQKGDYVNGILIESIYERTDKHLLCHAFNEEIMFEITKDNIEDIVTKEQFNCLKYEVK